MNSTIQNEICSAHKWNALSPLHPVVFMLTLYKALAAVASLLRGSESDSCTGEPNVGAKRGSVVMKASVLASIMLVLSVVSEAQPAQNSSPVFQVGERLQYRVSWGMFRLGTITMRTARERGNEDSTVFKVSMLVESNPDLRFVWIWEYYESLLDGEALFSERFYGRCINGDEDIQIRGVYDSTQRSAWYSRQDSKTGKPIIFDTLRQIPPFVEGSSLFFVTRRLAHTRTVTDVPTCVSGKISTTTLDFTHPVEVVEVAAIPHPVRAHKYTGTAHWTGGAAGVSGEFIGWLSDDEAAVPIKAEMKVILGSIRLELEKWDRIGWMPPHGLQTENRKP